MEGLAKYRGQLRLLAEGHKLTKKGTGLKLCGSQFGNLYVDPVALQAGRLQVRNGGNLVLDTSADQLLYDLLMKHLFKIKQYMPRAIETFKKLVKLAGLPVHGRKSKKHQLIRGSTIQYYSNPDDLFDRLQLLVASKNAGNTGLDSEISAILDELLRAGWISPPENYSFVFSSITTE